MTPTRIPLQTRRSSLIARLGRAALTATCLAAGLASAQQPIRFWMFIAWLHGIGVLAGAVMTIVHLITLKPAQPLRGEGADRMGLRHFPG